MSQHRYTADKLGEFWSDYQHAVDHWEWDSPQLDKIAAAKGLDLCDALEVADEAFGDFYNWLKNRDAAGNFGPRPAQPAPSGAAEPSEEAK